MMQTPLSDWYYIQAQIDRSTIKRYPYKSILGESLTKYILKRQEEGLSSWETISKIAKEEGIQLYCLQHPEEIDNLRKNIMISVCARYSETATRERL